MMRILYFLLNIFLNYPFRLYFPRIKKINAPKRFFGRTIYVSNHASSFFDPILIGVLQRPIVFFMTRSDVFKPALQPILWASHMLPIYREHDGEDTKGKNEEVFKKCNRILAFGRNLLLFGEGFTDDVFVRRLKPVKKGAVRIGFGALEATNWEKKIYMAAIGLNYSDPNHFGGDLLISNSDRFCLNDYKELYQENHAKAIVEVTKRIEKLMQEQITHVANKDWTHFHEQVCRLRRNGMNAVDTDKSIPLKQRWENSRKLALWLNAQDLTENQDLLTLKEDLDAYFRLQKKLHVEERYIHELASQGKISATKDLLYLILTAILLPLGLFHFFLPYLGVKKFVEKSFKRKVFWGSVKVILGSAIIALWNVPLVYLMNRFLIHNGWIALAYYLLLPIAGCLTYYWFKTLPVYKTKRILAKKDLSAVVQKRSQLLDKIDALIPVKLQ